MHQLRPNVPESCWRPSSYPKARPLTRTPTHVRLRARHGGRAATNHPTPTRPRLGILNRGIPGPHRSCRGCGADPRSLVGVAAERATECQEPSSRKGASAMKSDNAYRQICATGLPTALSNAVAIRGTTMRSYFLQSVRMRVDFLNVFLVEPRYPAFGGSLRAKG